MKTAAIYLHGVPMIDAPEAVKTVKFENENQLIAELKKLQDGYCEGEKPKIEKLIHSSGKPIIKAVSSADWHYVAYVGMRIKESCNKPIEILTFPVS